MLEPHLREKLIKTLSNRPEIIFAILYGSAAEDRPFRDVDIGLYVDRALLSEKDELGFALDLESALKKEVDHPVDVRIINDAPLPFRYNVSRGLPLVANDREALARFLERTWDDYLDFQPIALRYLQEQR